MDIKQLFYFKTIVEEGTISKAAEVLHMAQPPLSMQLKQLEEELGTQLLKRGHRKVELTPEGKLLYKRSLQMIDLHELIYHEIKDSQQEVLRIGVTSSNSAFIQQEKVNQYIKKHQNLSFRIHEGTTYEMIDLLLAHSIDIAIVRTPFDETQVKAYHLAHEPMIALAKPQYEISHKQKMLNFQNTPLIIHQRYLPLITDHCLNLHFNPHIKITSDDCRTSLIWASHGIGVAIIPQSALALNHDQSLVYTIIEDKELYTGISLITRKQEDIDPRILEFIELFFSNKRDMI